MDSVALATALFLSPDVLLLDAEPTNHLDFPAELRNHLGRFGVSGDLAQQLIGTMSGGQKSRVAFANITWPKPHFIIMDEPTNHLGRSFKHTQTGNSTGNRG